MTDIDTSLEAVERLARCNDALSQVGGSAAETTAATLRALASERDALREERDVISRSLTNSEETEHKLRRFLKISRDEGADAMATRDTWRARAERAEAALRFYADVSKYPAPFTGGMGALWADCGFTARQALGITTVHDRAAAQGGSEHE